MSGDPRDAGETLFLVLVLLATLGTGLVWWVWFYRICARLEARFGRHLGFVLGLHWLWWLTPLVRHVLPLVHVMRVWRMAEAGPVWLPRLWWALRLATQFLLGSCAGVGLWSLNQELDGG